jgi:predicted nucleotidyltransferase component of viral defense system
VTLSLRASVEVFHLLLLSEFSTKLDPRLYAIKGGCNLRFFFGSIRYSEDLDVDVKTVAPTTLRKNIRQTLEARALMLGAQVHGIRISGFSSPKQTDTTQRFKVQLDTAAGPAHTKIEFSRRGINEGVQGGRVDPSLLGAYGLGPTLLSHYDRQAAFVQKVDALIGRPATQARDVFDLDLLLAGARVDVALISAERRRAAVERLTSIDFKTFKSQVLAYLAPGHAAGFDSAAAWDALCFRVGESLEPE